MFRSSRWWLVALTVVLVAAPARPLAAQSVSIGIMAGGSLSTFTDDLVSDIKNSAGFIAGAFVHIGLAGFAVQPGIYYTTKGLQSDQFYPDNSGKQTIDYIQVPLVARLKLGPLYVGGGPAIGVKVGCTLGTGGTATDCSNAPTLNPPTTEISGIAEAGLGFGKFSLGLRADLGLSNLFNGGSINDVNVRTRTVSAIAEVRF